MEWQYIDTIFTNKALGQRQSVQFHYSPPNTPVNGTCVYHLLWWWNYGCRDNVALVNGMGWARLEWQVGLAEWLWLTRCRPSPSLGPVSGDATSDASPLAMKKVWSALGLADLASATFRNLSAFFFFFFFFFSFLLNIFTQDIPLGWKPLQMWGPAQHTLLHNLRDKPAIFLPRRSWERAVSTFCRAGIFVYMSENM